MKYHFLILVALLMVSTACKTCKNAQTKSVSTEQATTQPKTSGKVSHQYKATGCATVIVVKQKDTGETLTLIPKDALPKEFDTDGLEISFDYRLLKMPNPPGCNAGIPAEITNISKTK
jgi:uncharacterized protein YpmB